MSADEMPRQETATREPATMSVRHAAVWAVAGQYLGFAIQFISSVIISRCFLSPAEMGLFSIALSAAMLVSTLQDFGLSRYISALPTVTAAERARCSSVALTFSFLVAGTICATALPMAAAYHQPRLAPILLIIGISYLFLPLSVVPTALLARTMTFRGHFIITIGSTLAQGLVGVLLAAMGFSVFALAWATLAANVARGIIAQYLCPAPPWPLRFDGLRPVLSTGSRLTTLYASYSITIRTPDMIVGKALGLIAVGLFSRAVALSDQFRTLLSGAIGSVFFPAFARIRDRGEPLGPAYLRVIAGYTAVIWPGMAGLSLAAEPIVNLLYGPRWLGVAPLLSLIALADIFLVALPLSTDLPVLLGRLNRLLVFNFIDTLMSLTLLIGGLSWGVTGAAASRLVYGIAWVLLYARFLHGLVGFDLRALCAIYAKSAAATLAALAPLTLVYLCYTGPAHIGLPLLLLAVGAGAGLWAAALVLLRHPALDDLLGLAAHLPFGQRLVPLIRWCL